MKKELCVLAGSAVLAGMSIAMIAYGKSGLIAFMLALLAFLVGNVALWMQRARHRKEEAKWQAWKRSHT